MKTFQSFTKFQYVGALTHCNLAQVIQPMDKLAPTSAQYDHALNKCESLGLWYCLEDFKNVLPYRPNFY